MDAATVTAITGSFEFAEVITGIGTIFGVLMGLAVVMVGGRKILSVAKRG